MVQSHALQVLTLVAMEPPVSMDANAIRDEKVKVLRSLTPILPDDVDDATVRAQYTEGYAGRPSGARVIWKSRTCPPTR